VSITNPPVSPSLHHSITSSPLPADANFTAAVERAKLQALYQFAYGLSHEINNPLANIATRAQSLLVDERDPDRKRKLATIVQQAFRAHEMIADLMLFARPPALRVESVNLTQLVDTIVAEMQEQAREQGTKLTRVGSIDPLLANVDPTQIGVALKALVQNALEAVRMGGVVSVVADCGLRIADSDSERSSGDAVLSTRYPVPSTQHDPILHTTVLPPHFPNPQSAIPNPQFFLTVTDTGPGIPPETRAHIFDPFFCGREAGRGLGLGLSKAWRIAELHGGTIEVAGTTEGAQLTIALPVIT